MKNGHDDGNLHLDDVYKLELVVGKSPTRINTCRVDTVERVP
jgi:hypothetical protein